VRVDYHRLARIRLKEARLLLRARLSGGAHHTAGLVVECALKACIAKAIACHQFPDKSIAEKAWKHSAVELIQVPGLKVALDKDKISDPTIKAKWAIIAPNSELWFSVAGPKQFQILPTELTFRLSYSDLTIRSFEETQRWRASIVRREKSGAAD
jgi:hypothetical protein